MKSKHYQSDPRGEGIKAAQDKFHQSLNPYNRDMDYTRYALWLKSYAVERMLLDGYRVDLTQYLKDGVY